MDRHTDRQTDRETYECNVRMTNTLVGDLW